MKIICFGEPLLRLSSPHNLRWAQSASCDLHFGGAECNVAVDLSRWGLETQFVGKVPDNALGQSFENALKAQNVGCKYLQRGGERLGLYFLERGAGLRASQVIYDRAYSSFSRIERGEWDWSQVLDGANWLHFTGITPALGENVVQVLGEAIEAARAQNVKISCDVNFRAKLWDAQTASQVLAPLLRVADLLISNEEHARVLFGASGENDGEIAQSLARRLEAKTVAITRRGGVSGERNNFGATLWHENQIFVSREWEFAILDRVGSGDSFAAGLLRGLSQDLNTQEMLDFAVAACVLKHSISGDWCLADVKEIENLARGDGRVKR